MRVYSVRIDVWLGNARGNAYSKRHVSLDVNEEEFWDFSSVFNFLFDLTLSNKRCITLYWNDAKGFYNKYLRFDNIRTRCNASKLSFPITNQKLITKQQIYNFAIIKPLG